ncbi:hypothetical protein LTR66_005484 [Elasticomyces elasticus]|nr:hypothetical protein LTR66_005484 [Elasticomyces elasticus]
MAKGEREAAEPNTRSAKWLRWDRRGWRMDDSMAKDGQWRTDDGRAQRWGGEVGGDDVDEDDDDDGDDGNEEREPDEAMHNSAGR